MSGYCFSGAPPAGPVGATRHNHPSDFRSKKLATSFAFGGPRSSCAGHSATRFAMTSTNDLTPCRWPPVLVSTRAAARTPNQQPAIRLRGGRRTPLVRCRSPDFRVLLRSAIGERDRYGLDLSDRCKGIRASESEVAGASLQCKNGDGDGHQPAHGNHAATFRIDGGVCRACQRS